MDDKTKNDNLEKITTYCITYGTGQYTSQAQRLITEAKHHGFDHALAYCKNDLEQSFTLRNHTILTQARGDGYWLWKPYLVLKTLLSAPDGSLVIYIDSMYSIHTSARLLPFFTEYFKEHDKCDIWLSHNKPGEGQYPESTLTKSDAFTVLGMSPLDQRPQVWAGFIALRKSESSILLVSEWLAYCQDIRLISDQKDELGGKHNHYIDNRHDQSVLSLVSKRRGDIVFHDFPSDILVNLRLQPQQQQQRRRIIANCVGGLCNVLGCLIDATLLATNLNEMVDLLIYWPVTFENGAGLLDIFDVANKSLQPLINIKLINTYEFHFECEASSKIIRLFREERSIYDDQHHFSTQFKSINMYHFNSVQGLIDPLVGTFSDCDIYISDPQIPSYFQDNASIIKFFTLFNIKDAHKRKVATFLQKHKLVGGTP